MVSVGSELHPIISCGNAGKLDLLVTNQNVLKLMVLRRI